MTNKTHTLSSLKQLVTQQTQWLNINCSIPFPTLPTQNLKEKAKSNYIKFINPEDEAIREAMIKTLINGFKTKYPRTKITQEIVINLIKNHNNTYQQAISTHASSTALTR